MKNAVVSISVFVVSFASFFISTLFLKEGIVFQILDAIAVLGFASLLIAGSIASFKALRADLGKNPVIRIALKIISFCSGIFSGATGAAFLVLTIINHVKLITF